VRISLDEAVDRGKMFAAVGHTALQQARASGPLASSATTRLQRRRGRHRRCLPVIEVEKPGANARSTPHERWPPAQAAGGGSIVALSGSRLQPLLALCAHKV
jgi:hypothetical protein